MKIISPSFEILTPLDGQAILKHIELCGRVCYKSEDKITDTSAATFVASIIKRGHEAVLEHYDITVKFICDRGVSHELVRHRLASYCQESTRYCNYTADKFGGQIVCIDPATGFGYDLDDPADRRKHELWQEAMEAAERCYFQLIQAGARPEEARAVLPNALKTEIVMTMDLREWRHFLRLRTGRGAHPQIVEVAGMILREFAERYPVFFDDLSGGAK